MKILFDQKTAQVASKGDFRQYFQERMGWILIITTIHDKWRLLLINLRANRNLFLSMDGH